MSSLLDLAVRLGRPDLAFLCEPDAVDDFTKVVVPVQYYSHVIRKMNCSWCNGWRQVYTDKAGKDRCIHCFFEIGTKNDQVYL